MASLLHVTVGIAAGRLVTPRGRRAWGAMVGLAALSMLPDADVLAFSFGIPYHHPLGHRGATHSVAFAVAMGLLVGAGAAIARAGPRRAAQLGAVAGLTVLSHPLLDAMTTGGLGVGLWWPWSTERIFGPWRPIPVAPLGWGFLSESGLRVALAEAGPSLPVWIWALWPRRADDPVKK